MNRRNFLLSATSAAGTAFSAAETVSIAIAGTRGRGRALAGEFAKLADVRVAYLCDPDQNVVERSLKVLREAGQPAPQVVSDFRRALDDKSVDALVVATPDHWHGPATMLACEAGKDVYVEKPASHNLCEGRWMVEAARRNKRIVQVGVQSRSRASTQRAIEYIRSGKIGRVLAAKAWDVQLRENIGRKGDSPAPTGVDFDIWTGPAVMLPFNENRYHYKWHWHWNYGTGDIGNDGVHQLDICRWALGVDRPVRVSGMGRKLFFDDDQQTPDTMNITFEFDSKMIQFEMRIWNPYMLEGMDNGVAVYGTTGMVQIGDWNNKWTFRAYDEKGKLVHEDDGSGGESHQRNFVDCIKSRKLPNADIEIGHTSTLLAHLGNIVARTGRNLKFDPATESITGDAEASKLIGREYRRHWSTPKGASHA
jgi:predicted dehydrogenase